MTKVIVYQTILRDFRRMLRSFGWYSGYVVSRISYTWQLVSLRLCHFLDDCFSLHCGSRSWHNLIQLLKLVVVVVFLYKVFLFGCSLVFACPVIDYSVLCDLPSPNKSKTLKPYFQAIVHSPPLWKKKKKCLNLWIWIILTMKSTWSYTARSVYSSFNTWFEANILHRYKLPSLWSIQVSNEVVLYLIV